MKSSFSSGMTSLCACRPGAHLSSGKARFLIRIGPGHSGHFAPPFDQIQRKRNQEFSAHFFRSVGFRRWASAPQGNNIKNLNKSALEGYVLRLPPLEVRRRIVHLLDRAAQIRRRADAARAKTRAIIPALFFDMFGDPITNPKSWPTVELGHAAAISYGLAAKLDTTLDATGGHHIIAISNVLVDGSIDGGVRRFLSSFP